MHPRAATWFRDRSSTWRDWPLPRILADKVRTGTRISLVIPARNEADTVADIVATLHRRLVKDAPLIDELVVIDSDSTDHTAAVAARAGATVYRSSEIAPSLGSKPGKGEALWKSLFVTSGDVLAFVDADLTLWGPHFVTGIVGPLLADPSLRLVRAAYARVLIGPDGRRSTDGGRLTELVARPLLSLHWPELSGVAQPLAGEWAIRRDVMAALPIPVGYGVELSTLLDTAARYGLDAIAQVHLGERGHRHRSDAALGLAAAELLAVAESRRDRSVRRTVHLPRFEMDGQAWLDPVSQAVVTEERPPAASVAVAGADRP